MRGYTNGAEDTKDLLNQVFAIAAFGYARARG
jgi:hypothetical protein